MAHGGTGKNRKGRNGCGVEINSRRPAEIAPPRGRVEPESTVPGPGSPMRREDDPTPYSWTFRKLSFPVKRSSRRRRTIRKARFSEEQIPYALRQGKSGKPVGEIRRLMDLGGIHGHCWDRRVFQTSPGRLFFRDGVMRLRFFPGGQRRTVD